MKATVLLTDNSRIGRNGTCNGIDGVLLRFASEQDSSPIGAVRVRCDADAYGVSQRDKYRMRCVGDDSTRDLENALAPIDSNRRSDDT